MKGLVRVRDRVVTATEIGSFGRAGHRGGVRSFQTRSDPLRFSKAVSTDAIWLDSRQGAGRWIALW